MPRVGLWQRGRLTRFVELHHTRWELSVGALAVVYLGVGFLEDEGHHPPALLLGALAVAFGVEFTARCWDSPSRRRYFRHHWLDLVSCIPLVGGLRAVRLLRLLRLGAVLRIFLLAEHEAEGHQRSRQSFAFVGPVLVLVWLVSALAYWTLEHGINPTVHNFGDALYWSFITATTVGYGDVTPVTPEGRILAGGLIFVGIGLVGFASAQLTQRFLRVGVDQGVVDLGQRIDALQEQLDRIEAAVSTRGTE
jgi:voltage-gated potassium channel